MLCDLLIFFHKYVYQNSHFFFFFPSKTRHRTRVRSTTTRTVSNNNRIGQTTQKNNNSMIEMPSRRIVAGRLGLTRGIGASLLVHSDMFSLMCSGVLDDDGT